MFAIEPDAATNSTHDAFACRHLTDEILTPFHFHATNPLSDHISLTSFIVFLWNWDTFFYKQTGRLDLNSTRPHWENAADVCLSCKISRWLICLMSTGHFCGNLLFRINFRPGTSRHSWLVSLWSYFSSIFCSYFHKTWHFPNTF